jgi:FAD/FMN-containing dehydrogenase
VLEVTAVSAEGRVVRAGAPLVKNVTGYDLCRLLVGSHGTLAFIAEVVLRCQPRPPVESWWRCEGADPFELCRRLYRPLAVLWDGTTTWVGVSGHRADVDAQAAKVLRTGDGAAVPVEGPPGPPGRIRRSLSPADLGALPRGGAAGSAGRWLAEIGVGIVHCDEDAAASVRAQHAGPEVVELHRRLKEGFDPTGRLNPGRSPLAAASAGVGS